MSKTSQSKEKNSLSNESGDVENFSSHRKIWLKKMPRDSPSGAELWRRRHSERHSGDKWREFATDGTTAAAMERDVGPKVVAGGTRWRQQSLRSWREGGGGGGGGGRSEERDGFFFLFFFQSKKGRFQNGSSRLGLRISDTFGADICRR
ncbi:hypothetical protein TIFTF001_012854 [Ficus carica]|uniref:Uncharacterized protein n=1 Tax=Ficus carica TaxID=3494 RepID=A0AA87ZWM8_FICCA|nr:hypothetical protein TIFTF001_012854 [Ficus carica]